MSMNGRVKRLLAIVLSAAFTVTSLPVHAYAQSEQIEIGNTQAEEILQEEPDEQAVSGDGVSQNASGNQAVKEADITADEDAYEGLKIVSPASKRVYSDGREEYISENEVPKERAAQRSSEHKIKIDTSRLSDESGVEVSYSSSASADDPKTVIWSVSDNAGTKEVNIPAYSYLWVRATGVKADTAVVMRAVRRQSADDYYVQDTGCFYRTGEYVYQFYTYDNYDLFFEEDNNLKAVTFDIPEKYRNDITVENQTGETISTGDKISDSDTLKVVYSGSGIAEPYQLKIYFDPTDSYRTQYITNDNREVWISASKDSSTLHMEEVEQHDVTITVPEEYKDYLEFYSTQECTPGSEIYTGTATEQSQGLDAGKSIYVKKLKDAPEGKRFYITYTYNNSTYYAGALSSLQSENPQYCCTMAGYDLSIVVSCVEPKAVTFVNECPDEVEFYGKRDETSGELTEKIEGTKNMMPGDTYCERK